MLPLGIFDTTSTGGQYCRTLQNQPIVALTPPSPPQQGRARDPGNGLMARRKIVRSLTSARALERIFVKRVSYMDRTVPMQIHPRAMDQVLCWGEAFVGTTRPANQGAAVNRVTITASCGQYFCPAFFEGEKLLVDVRTSPTFARTIDSMALALLDYGRRHM